MAATNPPCPQGSGQSNQGESAVSAGQPVQPPLEFIPVHYRPWVVRSSYALLPLVLRLRLQPWLPAGIGPVTCSNPEVLADYFHRFQAGELRLLMAFRHSQVDDPLCLSYLFSRLIPTAARRHGISLKPPIHSFFMYDRGMPLWAGRWLGWFFSSMGGIPVRRGRRLDLKALKAVRHYLVNGPFPVTIAPEGATNGHGEVISPLEPGTAQVAFWAVEDLHQAQRPQQVLVVPVGLQYFYPRPDWAALDRLLGRLEQDCGLEVPPWENPGQRSPQAYGHRLLTLGHHLLTQMEGFYQRLYGPLPATTDQGRDRLQTLLHKALVVGEAYFKLPSTGSLETRCRRLEEAGWTHIYREDLAAGPHQGCPFNQGLANWMATAAALQVRPMRLVESFVAVRDSYVQGQPSFERLAETSLILFDLVERVKGTRVPRRPQLGRRQAVISLADPINVSQRWSTYQPSRQAAKAAVDQLTQDLQAALEGLILPTGTPPR